MSDRQWPALLRDLRHELRTPINHIVGYSELLLDVAEEQGRADLLPDLQRISAAGRELGALVNEALQGAAVETTPPDTVALSRALRTPLTTIVGYSELLEEDAERGQDAAMLPDLQRIKTASRRLLGQIHAMLDLAPGPPADGGPTDRAAAESTLAAGAPPAPVPATLAASPTADPTIASATAPAAGTAAATLLVVDDDEANRDMLSRRLQRLGHTVVVAEDGQAALACLAAQPFDLILLDIVMPELDGYEVLQRLKASAELRHLPVLVLSASDELDTAVRCIELGADDYLPKPIDAVLLRARIGASLEKKRLHDQERQHLATIERMAAEMADWNRTLEQRVQDGLARLERTDRLKRFLPAQIAEQIVSTGDESLLESHRRNIAVLFCDLRGFTAFTEMAEPEEVMSILQEYHEAVGGPVAEFAGTVEHFAGDGLMIVFNDPVPCPEPELRAVQLALTLRASMAALAAAWRQRGYDLGFGIGIASGYATLGCIGFAGRFHYGAIGSVVNLASRLCDEARDGQVLTNVRVRAAVGERAQFEPLPDLSLKGVSRPVRTFSVVG